MVSSFEYNLIRFRIKWTNISKVNEHSKRINFGSPSQNIVNEFGDIFLQQKFLIRLWQGLEHWVVHSKMPDHLLKKIGVFIDILHGNIVDPFVKCNEVCN